MLPSANTDGGLQRHSYLLEGCHGDPTPITRFNTPETYQLDLTSLRATIQPFAPSTKLSGAVMNRPLGTARYRGDAEAPAPEPGRFLPTSDYDVLQLQPWTKEDVCGRSQSCRDPTARTASLVNPLSSNSSICVHVFMQRFFRFTSNWIIVTFCSQLFILLLGGLSHDVIRYDAPGNQKVPDSIPGPSRGSDPLPAPCSLLIVSPAPCIAPANRCDRRL